MASDNFNWEILVRLAVQGGPQAKSAIEDLARSANTGEKASEGLSKALAKVERDSKKTAGSANILSGGLKEGTGAINEQAKAASNGSLSLRDLETSTTSLRYANYDLATSMFAVSGGIVAAGTGVVVAAAKYESAFTAVERTSGLAGESAAGLRDELMQLTREIPQSFEEIANLAARGAQLGIASGQIADFTEVVAQFVATSDTVTLDQAVEAFGRISNLLGDDDFNRLGSAITLVGVNAAATEAQIIKTTQELAPFAAAVGMSTEDVIGLSAAVASLGQPPERARSAFLTLQKVVDGAVSGMNDKLSSFAGILGMTEEQTAALWKQDPGQFVQSFVHALGSVDNLTVAFNDLGINERRAVQVFQALAADSRNAAGGMSKLDQAFRDSNQGYAEGTELQRQYALILDDLASKWQIFLNAAMEASAAVGGALVPTLKTLVDSATAVLQAFAAFAGTDTGQMFIRLVSTIGGLVATYAALRGGIALATGSLQAFATISRALGGAGIMAGLKGLVSAFTLARGEAVATSAVVGHQLPAAFGTGGVAASRFAGAMRVAGGALLAFGRATVILGLLQAATSLIFDFGGSMQWLAGVASQVVSFIGSSFANAANYVAGLAQTIGSVVPGMDALSGTLRAFALTTKAHVSAGTLTKDFTKWAGSLKTADDGLGDLGSTAGGIPFGDYADQTDDWANKTDGLGNAAGGAAREVRTLVDYASDLQSVFSRAFDIRFSGGSTLDAIRSTFIGIREATAESARNIAKLKAEIQGLQSDLSTQQYFLSIALEYKDYARAEAIQANIAKLQADLADKTASLSDEQAKNSKSLTGNSKAAIDNRKKMEDLVKQYQEHITALASSGLSQDELARRTGLLREQFVQQATQLGYSRDEVEKYARAFDDIKVAIQGVPRNITVNANANPALQALSEFMAKAKTQIGSGLRVPISATPDYRGLSSQGKAGEYQGNMQNALANMVAAASRGDIVATQRWRVDLIRWATLLKNGGFSGGGFTGQGGKYEPAGVVHRGEYVIPKKDVNQRTGLPYADAMGRLQRGASGPGYAGGGFVRAGGAAGTAGVISSLGPMAQQQFGQLFAQYMRVYLDGQVIARSTATQYADQTAVGAY